MSDWRRERPLVATYRLQLHPGFTFADAAAVVPYLHDLGVSHLYLSPCFEATAGSTHGYDVVDPNRLRDELGGEAGFRQLVATAHDAGLGIVIDIVPHHMAATATNRWWWSVLELGRDSPFARHFDIDWDPPEQRLRGTVLLPVLGDHYGRVLEAGELCLAVDGERVVVRYFDQVAPLSPETAAELWAEADRVDGDIGAVVSAVNADVDRLDALLNRQHHRFARWQAAAHELDYRRFFDIDSLVALRSERNTVFADTHRLTSALVGEGLLDGLRIDHVDGLRDPQAYLEQLRAAAPDAWIVVEKILRRSESIPDAWPVHGTTGYDFLATVTGLQIGPAGLDRLRDAYEQFTGDDAGYEQTAVEARGEALRESLAADLDRVVNLLLRVCEGNRRWRDFTRTELRDALGEICLHCPGYRSYVRTGESPRRADVAFITRAITAAAAARPDLDSGLLELIRELLLGELTGEAEAELVARFQQLTGPVAAKGEEDTAFYRWVPLLAANDVGTEPDDVAVSVEQFHDDCRERLANWPAAQLTASTHDTKRSEDVRARLAVLSERADEWIETVERWSARNAHHRDAELDAPDRRDEWFIYQTLVGAHPVPFERVQAVIEKSLREAKRRTSWVRVNEGYERATMHFLRAILDDVEFMGDLDRFVGGIAGAGRVNSIAQTALRLLAPGVPDVYQGTELWDLSLVDPDNRRPVDYEERRAVLAALPAADLTELWSEEDDLGRAKLAVVHRCLALRRRHPDAFGPGGTYEPLPVTGDAERVVAFCRGDAVVVAVPRHSASGPPDDAVVALPEGEWRSVVSGDRTSGDVPFTKLSGGFPIALLERDLDPVV